MVASHLLTFSVGEFRARDRELKKLDTVLGIPDGKSKPEAGPKASSRHFVRTHSRDGGRGTYKTVAHGSGISSIIPVFVK